MSPIGAPHQRKVLTPEETVAVIQQELRARGFRSVEVDGVAGASTLGALRRFEQLHGFLPSKATAGALQALRGDAIPAKLPPPPPCGDSHGHVHVAAPSTAAAPPAAPSPAPPSAPSGPSTPRRPPAKRRRSHAGGSALRARDLVTARRLILKAAKWMVAHKDEVTYTESLSLRWSAIDERRRIARGQYLQYGDCSSTVTWMLWNAFTHRNPDFPDVVNGEEWRAGFTGTIAAHGTLVPSLSQVRVGDLILYGSPPSYEHVTIAVGRGLCFSHGSMAGPFILPICDPSLMQLRLGPVRRFL